MALTALQQLQNESALIQQGKIGEAVASSQSYVAAQPKVTPVVTPTTPVPVAPVISPPAAVAKPVVTTPTVSPTIAPAPVAKPVVSTPAVVAPKYVTRNLSAEQKALSDILASSNIKDGTDVTTLSAATQKLLQENINNAVYGTGSPLFYGTPPPTVAPAVAPTTPTIAPAINRPVLDALIPSTPIEPVSPYFTSLPEEPVSLQEVRDEQLALAQASVDATEAYFQASLARINAIGTSNLAQTSSIAVGAGLAGSPFQQALEQSTVGATTTALGEVSAQRSAEVSNFLAQAENNAQNIYQQGVANYKNDLSFYANERDKEIAYEEAHAEAIKESGLETINNIAKSGYSLDEMPKDQYQQLLANTGLSDFEARAVWAAGTPEANATYSTQNGFLVGTYFDPHTKKPVVTVTKLPDSLQETSNPKLKTEVIGGKMYVWDENNPLYDDNGNLVLIKAVSDGVQVEEVVKQEDLPATIQEYEYAVSQGYNGSFIDFQNQKVSSTSQKPPTQGAYDAYGFAIRMENSVKIIDALDQKFTGIYGQGSQWTPDFLRSSDRKSIEQAERDFINAILRRESGAAVSPAEFESATKQYFPQAGDSAQILEQKKNNRDLVLHGVKIQAKSVYEEQGQNFNGGDQSGGNGVVTRDDGSPIVIQSSYNDLSSLLRDYPELETDAQAQIESGNSPREIIEYYQNIYSGSQASDHDLSLTQKNFKVAVKGDIQPALTTSTVKLGNKKVTVNSAISKLLTMADSEYFKATGKHIPISESFRTTERQKALFAELSARGARVVPPGYSFHELGMAIDVGNAWKQVRPYLNKYGFLNGIEGDMGHFSIGELS